VWIVETPAIAGYGHDFMRSTKLWLILVVVLAVVVLFAFLLLRPARPQTMRHALTGYVLGVTPEMNRITVRNADIPGIMTSMVMDYRVKDAAAIAGIKSGTSFRQL
jgi:Cu/Ag efflux protein CusF